ncbi:MAG TPA: oligosaccharide flippase family protein [Anaerolineales bacterium]
MANRPNSPWVQVHAFSRLSRLSLNSLWLLLSRVATQLGMALFTILLARGLGSAAFGEYAFMASVIVVGNVLTTFGTDMLLIREIAATGSLKALSSALWLQMGLSAPFIGLVFLASAIVRFPDPAAVHALRIYSLSMLPLAFYTVFTTALRGRQQMLGYALLNLALMLMQLAAAAWVLRARGDLIQLAVLLLSVQAAGAVTAALLCAIQLPDFRGAWGLSTSEIASLIKASAPIALLGLLGVIYQRLSLIALPWLAGVMATGLFSAGARLIEAAKIVHLSVFTAIYPAMSALRNASVDRWARDFRAPAMVLLAAAFIGSSGLCLFAAPVVLLLYGAEYGSSIAVVRILAWLLPAYTINSFLTLAFLARGQEAAIARALALSIIVLIVLMVWWTPAAGAVGAAWAALFAEVSQAAALVWMDVRGMKMLRAVLTRKA